MMPPSGATTGLPMMFVSVVNDRICAPVELFKATSLFPAAAYKVLPLRIGEPVLWAPSATDQRTPADVTANTSPLLSSTYRVLSGPTTGEVQNCAFLAAASVCCQRMTPVFGSSA